MLNWLMFRFPDDAKLIAMVDTGSIIISTFPHRQNIIKIIFDLQHIGYTKNMCNISISFKVLF